VIKNKMDYNALTWMSLPWPAVTLTFDLKNLIRSSVGASECYLYVSSRLLKPLARYCGNKICPDKRTWQMDKQKTQCILPPQQSTKSGW